jgi:hypothetical protein
VTDGVLRATIADGADQESDRAVRRAALRAHERLLDAIEVGNQDRASRAATAHLGLSHSRTLSSGDSQSILVNLVSDMAGAAPAPAGAEGNGHAARQPPDGRLTARP